MNQVPNKLSQKILDEVKSRLQPDLKILILKLFAIHIATAIVTLSICPQFGFSVFRSGIDLMDVFMKLGPHFCEFACGAFFTGMSMISAIIVLSRDEIRVLRHKKIFTVLMMLLVSTGFLIMLSPALFVQISLLWLLGSIGGIVASMEIAIRVRG